MASPVHTFRPAAAPRNSVRDTCIIQTAPFSDWLKPANQPFPAATTSAMKSNNTSNRYTGQIRPGNSTKRRDTGTPGSARVPATTAANTPANSISTDSILTILNNGERPPLPWELEAQISHIEWVVLHSLGKNFPEAYQYIMKKALERGGDNELIEMLRRKKK
ncbi:MAG: hypothetical protein SGI92_33510 [Bryobacteraceae bacterium]|nr:hypothetical protein [Bryobacteraceae bacterium]